MRWLAGALTLVGCGSLLCLAPMFTNPLPTIDVSTPVISACCAVVGNVMHIRVGSWRFGVGDNLLLNAATAPEDRTNAAIFSGGYSETNNEAQSPR